MTDTTKRAELLALADEYEGEAKGNIALGDKGEARKCELAASALRRLAAQDQKPVAWCSGDELDNILDDRTATVLGVRDGFRNTPLYLSPPPAAGWNEAIEAVISIAKDTRDKYSRPTGDQYTQGLWDQSQRIIGMVKALRHNAPPDSAAGKSEQPCGMHQKPDGRWGCLECDQSWDTKHLCMKQSAREARIGAHVFAQAKSLGWQDDGEGAYEFMMRYCREVALEDCKQHDPSALPPICSALSHQPDAAETNASAEARLRDALEQIIRYCDESTDPVIALTAKKALSAHSPVSDCDKHGCMGDMAPGDPKDLAELLAKPSVLEPSDRTAGVTWGELHAFILKHGGEWEDEGVAARALLDAFTVGRR